VTAEGVGIIMTANKEFIIAWFDEARIKKGVLLMLKRFTVILVILMIVASMGTVFAAPTMSDSKKTMNDLIKGEQMISNEKDAITAFKDQMILMMHIGAIDQMMMAMTPEQVKTTAQSFLKTQITQETKEQLIISIHKMMLDMNQDQLSSMLDKELPVMSLNAQRNMLKDNNRMVTKPRGLALD
jgi:ligand-binding sensor domain-containing protein